MSPLFKNQNFKLPDGRTYVLLGTAGRAGTAYIIDKFGKNAFPQSKYTMDWLTKNAESIDTAEQERALSAARESASPASIARAEVRWSQIEGIVGNPDLYREGARWLLVQNHAREVGCSPITILTALRLYWQGGQTQDALLGYRPKQREVSEGEDPSDEKVVEDVPCRRGRPAVKAGMVNFHARRLDKENYKKVIEKYFLKDERLTVSAAYDRLLQDHYSYWDGNGVRTIHPAGERPTRKQFAHYLKANYPVEYQTRCRKGHKSFERDHRPVLGTVEDICHGVAHIYEMDATIADVTIVSSVCRADIIGRPTVYLIVDRASRLIVGWYAGLEAPCWPAALQAIFSIAEDKQQLCARLGIEYCAADWPATGILPQQLFVDRGESTTREAERLPRAGTIVTNLPSCRPDWKPVVESRFKLNHQAISQIQVPGYNPASNAGKRRATDYSKDAVLTLEEFESILVKVIVTYNRKIMRAYSLSREQIADGVEPSPVALFVHGLTRRTGDLAKFREDVLRLALLPDAIATIDEHGINVHGMCYQPKEEGLHRAWFVSGRKSTGQVKVSFDRRRVDIIYVHDKSAPGGYFIAGLARHSVKYAGLSLQEALWLQKQEEKLHAGAEQSKHQANSDLDAHSRPIIEGAKRKTAEDARGVSKTGRRENAKPAREQEKNLERDAMVERNVPAAPSAEQIQIPPAPSSVRYMPPRVNPAASAARRARQLLDNQGPL